MTPRQVTDIINAMSADDPDSSYPVTVDPSIFAHRDGVTTAEKFIDAGLIVVGADNSRVQGWMRVHEYLYGDEIEIPMLQIFSNCLESIEFLPEMIHDPKNPLDCLKNSQIDHHPDTIRYHLMTRPAIARTPKKIVPWNCLSELRKRKIITLGGGIYGE
jgi:hypothetical protein